MIEIEFIVGHLRSAYTSACSALSLPVGATLSSHVRLEPHGAYFDVYVSGDLAEEFLDLKEGTLIRVRAKTVYGVEDGTMSGEQDQEHKGLAVEAILAVTTPPSS